MYDRDGQFDEMLGLPIQLRKRVSDPGTPLVRASPRAPGYGGGTGGATVNIGSGPGLYTVQSRTVPPHHSLNLEKPKLLKAR